MSTTDFGKAIDTTFDMAEQVLEMQRRFAHQVLASTQPVFNAAMGVARPETVTRPVARATQTVADATKEAADERRRERRADYESMTVEELQDEAQKAGIEGRSQMKKQELVKALTEASA